MSEGKPPSGAAPAAPRAVPTALRPLQWMGIPQGILTWKPRLPSRNWSIFWLSVTSLSLLYYEDRRQCKKILEEYKERVRGLAEEPMLPKDLPRKVTVYTAKYPGDDDYEVGALYFRRYVKPILAAAAVDYEIISGTRYGGLARDLRDRIHERRRNLAGVLPWPSPIGPNAPIMPFLPTPAQQLQRELDECRGIAERATRDLESARDQLQQMHLDLERQQRDARARDASASRAELEALRARALDAETRLEEATAAHQERTTQLENDYLTAVQFVRNTENMLRRLKDEHLKLRQDNAELRAGLGRASSATGYADDTSRGLSAGRAYRAGDA